MSCDKQQHESHVLKAFIFLTSYIAEPGPDIADTKHSLTHLIMDYRDLIVKNEELGIIALQAIKKAKDLEIKLAEAQKTYAELLTTSTLASMIKPN